LGEIITVLDKIVGILIKVGREVDRVKNPLWHLIVDATQEFLLVSHRSQVYFSSAEWKAACRALTSNDFRELLRGLIKAEHHLSWQGGSVAQSINVFKLYHDKFPTDAVEFSQWVLRHSWHNDYVQKAVAWTILTPEEKAAREKADAERRAEIKRGEKRQQELKAKVTAKKAVDHKKRVKQGAERAVQVKALNSRLASLAPIDRMPTIIADDVPLEVVDPEHLTPSVVTIHQQYFPFAA
jgi:hypothetical protein